MELRVWCTVTRKRPKRGWYAVAQMESRDLFLTREAALGYRAAGWTVDVRVCRRLPEIPWEACKAIDWVPTAGPFTRVQFIDELKLIASDWP